MIRYGSSGIIENLFEFMDALNKYRKSNNNISEISQTLDEYSISPNEFIEFLNINNSTKKFFNNTLTVTVFNSDTNKKLFDLFSDVFSVVKYFLYYAGNLKNVHSLPDEIVLDILVSFGFDEAANIRKDISKALFLNNVPYIVSKKGNAYGLDTFLSYFLKNRNIGNLYEWWLYYKGDSRGNATEYDFVFKPVIAWSDWVYKEDEDIEILYPYFINSLPTWHYSKFGNRKVSELYKELYLDVFPVATSYLSFCFPQDNLNRSLNYSFLNKYLNECYHYFVRDVLYEKYPKVIGTVTNIEYFDNTWYISVDQTGRLSIYELSKECDYININNTVYVLNVDRTLVKVDDEFIEYLPENLLLTPRQTIYIDDSAYVYNIDAYKNLRLITLNSLGEPYIRVSLLDAHYLIYLFNNFEVFELYEYIGYYTDPHDIEVILSFPLKTGSYFVTPENIYISKNNQWYIAKSLFFDDNEYSPEFRLVGIQLLFLFPVEYKSNIKSDNSVLMLNKQVMFLNRELYWYDFHDDLRKYFGDLTNHVYELVLPYRLINNREKLENLYYNCFDVSAYDWINSLFEVCNLIGGSVHEQYKNNIEHELIDRIQTNIYNTIFKKNLLDNNLLSDLNEVVTIPNLLKNYIKIKENSIYIDFNTSVIDIDSIILYPEKVFPVKSHNNRAEFVAYSNLIFEADIDFFGIVSLIDIIFDFYTDGTNHYRYHDIIYFDNDNSNNKIRIDLNSVLADRNYKCIYKIVFKINNAIYEQKSGIVLKNIKLTINTENDSYKYIKNPFEYKPNIIQINDQSNFYINNISDLIKPALLIDNSLTILEKNDITNYIQSNSNNIFDNDLFLIDSSPNNNNSFGIVKFFKKDVNNYNDINLFIVLPLFKNYNKPNNRDVCGFEIGINYLNSFPQNIDIKISAIEIPRHEIYSKQKIIENIAKNKINIYSIISTKSSGLYRTFFDRCKANVIWINISFKNIQKKYKSIDNFVFFEFSNLCLDKDIIFGFKKDYNSIINYSIDFLKISNHNLINRIKQEINNIIQNNRNYTQAIKLLFESIIDDIFSFYTNNDIGISKDFIKETNNYNFNERVSIFRKLVDEYKPMRCVLLPNIGVYKINTYNSYMSAIDTVTNIKNDLFWDLIDSSKTYNLDTVKLINNLKLFTKNDEKVDQFTSNIKYSYGICKNIKDILFKIILQDNTITGFDSTFEYNDYGGITIATKTKNVYIPTVEFLKYKGNINISLDVQKNTDRLYFDKGIYVLNEDVLDILNIIPDVNNNQLTFDTSTDNATNMGIYAIFLENQKIDKNTIKDGNYTIHRIRPLQNENIKGYNINFDYKLIHYVPSDMSSFIIFGNISTYFNILYNFISNRELLENVPSISYIYQLQASNNWINTNITNVSEYPMNVLYIFAPIGTKLDIKFNKINLIKGE